MRGEFKLPTKLPGKPIKNSQKGVINNDVYSSPYEIRVRPPTTFVAPSTNQPINNQNDAESIVSDEAAPGDDGSSKLTIIRLGRSLLKDSNADDESLPVLSEQDAEQLSRFLD